MTNEEHDERMAKERELVDGILLPFYSLKTLLEGEMKMVGSANVATLMDLALQRAEDLADGRE